jgi:soluble lytic murein transglycosylase-like protein
MGTPLSPLQHEAQQAALRHGLDPVLFTAQIRQESGFNPKARSHVGAQGIAQIMPATAKAWGIDPRNPKQALNAAAKNMAGYIRTYKKQGKSESQAQAMALAAYNAGPGAVKKHGGVPPYKETRNYVQRIMSAVKKGRSKDEHV